MPNSKSSSIREVVIDRCLSGPEMMNTNEIWDEVNRVLVEHGEKPVHSKVTILTDIASISERWNIEIEQKYIEKKKYFRYKDREFSIFKAPLRIEDIQKLNQTLDILKDFIGLPHFEWIEEINARIHATTYTNVEKLPIVSFARNTEYAQTLKHFTPLFDLIKAKVAISLTYKKFNSDTEKTHIVHPYHLKEYADRWYLVCSLEKYPDNLTCFAFDRIISYERSETPYRENTKIDIEEYFDSMVGLTIHEDTEPEEILLWVEDTEYPYIVSNPIHHSQRFVGNEKGGKVVSMKLYLNIELEMRILSYGEKVRVLAPSSFRERIKERVKSLNDAYKD